MPEPAANPDAGATEDAPRLIPTWRSLGFALGVAAVVAAVPTSSAYLAAGGGDFGRWWVYFAHIGPYYALWALATPAIHRLATGPLSPGRGWPRAVAGHLGVLAALSFGFGLIVHHENAAAWLTGINAPGYHAMSAFTYGVILLGTYAYGLIREVQRQRTVIEAQARRTLRLEAGLARAELEALRGQMNPHFLFNALNGIGALIDLGDNDRAYEALEDLGALLRTSLELRDRRRVPLAEELGFAERYVAMERLRFGERLSFRRDLEHRTGSWPVPPFILQPLIENAVKHAVATGHEPVTVTVRSAVQAGRLRLEVDNTRPRRAKSADSAAGTGVGLANLRQRLDLLYGDEADLTFRQNGDRTCVALRIPRELAAPPAGKPAVTERKTGRAAAGAVVQHGAS